MLRVKVLVAHMSPRGAESAGGTRLVCVGVGTGDKSGLGGTGNQDSDDTSKVHNIMYLHSRFITVASLSSTTISGRRGSGLRLEVGVGTNWIEYPSPL